MEPRAERSPHTFQTFETSEGGQIFRIPMHLFPDLWGYAYLVQMEDGLVLIDTGSGFGDSNSQLEAGFEQASKEAGRTIRFSDLDHILITHGHIDHFGGLVFLQERTDALVGIHELDMGNLTNYEERVAISEIRLKAYLVEAGVPEARREDILNMYRVNKMLFHSVRVDFTYEAKGMRLGAFEMLHVPGHCAGHVIIRLHKHLFGGDHVLGRISPHQNPERLTLSTGLGHYLDSLTVLEKWAGSSSVVLAGHDDPITDLPARLEEIRQGHAARLKRTLEFLATPHTIAEVADTLFGHVDGYHALLALEEAGAHVEFLHQHGSLRIVNLDELGSIDCPSLTLYQSLNRPESKNITKRDTLGT